MNLLLSSVFGPYGVDDSYGRKENLMELFHNQITREQGVFSLRFHHQSFGLHMLAENVSVPTTVLDFPSQERFIREIEKGYDHIGISFATPNFAKARQMGELVRRHAPCSKILLGGQGTHIPDVEALVEHDHICKGEGVKWLREIFGEPPDRPFKHPAVPSAFSKRIMGVPIRTDTAVLIPGLGCVNGCPFCSTSHFFNRQYIPYFDSGQELFDVCVELEKTLGFDEFFVIDENFLKYPDRARDLLRLMEKYGKLFRFGIFSSAEAIKNVGIEFLVRLGVYTVWIGVESKIETYEKNRGIDLRKMIGDLRNHGVSVLASGILFLEHHDKDTIWNDVDFMVGLEADLVQFMQLAPMPVTPLYKEYDERGILRKDVPFEEWHGQHRIWYDHPHFTPDESAGVLRSAFERDHHVNGSSLLRMCDTVIRGYRNLARYREPFMVQRRGVLRRWANAYRPSLPVLRKYAANDRVRALTERVTKEYDALLGPMSLKQKALSKVALACASREIARSRSAALPRQPKTILTRYRM